jgi:hypothetical protein
MTIILPREYSIWILRVSHLSFLSAVYAFWKQCPIEIQLVPLSVGCSSVFYWKMPDTSWRRYLDILVVQIALWFQCYRVWNAEYSLLYYGITGAGITCFIVGLLSYYHWRSYGISTATHCMLHILANLANLIVYSGKI